MEPLTPTRQKFFENVGRLMSHIMTYDQITYETRVDGDSVKIKLWRMEVLYLQYHLIWDSKMEMIALVSTVGLTNRGQIIVPCLPCYNNFTLHPGMDNTYIIINACFLECNSKSVWGSRIILILSFWG